MKHGGKISTSPTCVIDITGTDPLSWGGGGLIMKIRNMRYF